MFVIQTRHSVTKATLIAVICTFFEVFNVPVFWPILLLYFITLFMITMKRQIAVSLSPVVLFACSLVFTNSNRRSSLLLNDAQHMIKYQYLPWTTGKTKYRGKDDSSKVYSK
jgi:hypothetical protein